MNVAINASPNLLPKTRKLVELFKTWGSAFPKHHKHTFYTTPQGRVELSSLILGLPNCHVSVVLPGTVRSFPMDQNEPFHVIAKHEHECEWFYLSEGTLPLEPDWIDQLKTAYDAGGKPILGKAAYTPRRFRDPAGIDRVTDGDPYILEAAVYPPSYLEHTKRIPLNLRTHHEVLAGPERYQHATLTDLIGNASFAETVPANGAVVLTRLIGTAQVEALLNAAPLAPGLNMKPVWVPPGKMQVVETPAPKFSNPEEEIVASFKVETPKPQAPYQETTNAQGRKVIKLGAKPDQGMTPLEAATCLPPCLDSDAPTLPPDEVVWINPPEPACCAPTVDDPRTFPPTSVQEWNEAIERGKQEEVHPDYLTAPYETTSTPEPRPLIEEVSLKIPMASAKKKIKVPKRNSRAKFRHLVKPKA